jgi:hypothetical protein
VNKTNVEIVGAATSSENIIKVNSVSFTDLLFTHVGLAYMFLCIREILFPTVCLFILEDEIKQ